MSDLENSTASTRPLRILAVEDNEDLRRSTAMLLELEGFEVLEAADGDEGVRMATQFRPDLILMDVMMPKMTGTEALVELRKNFRTAFTPVIFLTAKSRVTDRVAHLLSGADDYLVKPFDPEELAARVRVAIRRARSLRGLNPITGLPGNTAIAGEITARLAEERPFACLHIDLDNFKSFNDHHGFSRGDEAIGLTGRILLEVLESAPSTDGQFAGHIGGDDFVALTAPEQAEAVAEEIVRRFDEAAPKLYDPMDRERGWIEVQDRQGRLSHVPLVSISIGIALSDRRKFASAAEVASAAGEMKTLAKRTLGSAWVVDRRRAGS